MDLVVSVVALVLLGPLFGAIALAIKLDSSGPVFFRRRLVGQFGKPFVAYKFRSMVADAHERMLNDPGLLREYQEYLKIQEDPRITRVGHFLRRTSLDELPQFFNVLKGDMSLVGPRMLGDIELARCGESGEKILRVKPGIAGLWAVSGRHAVSFERRVEMELDYVNKWSLLLDIKILLKCFGAVFGMEGAK
jgi:lipopolysaccharide/colanic/teichoic acid biosynthesis glycosyltransferase